MILVKHLFESHVELHYKEKPSGKTYLQYLSLSDKFYREKIDACSGFAFKDEYIDNLYSSYSLYTPNNEFNFLKTNSFNTFFSLCHIDIPKCFTRSKSLKRFSNEVALLKFNNYFMRNGERYKSFRFFTQSS